MRGSNDLQFNEATMIDIVQYWLDNKWLNKDERKPKVTGIKYNSSPTAYNQTGQFTINMVNDPDLKTEK